ncbi:hypothetical protein CMQ_7696 [Grosmannia clavigera kw1407]|uniref:Uncharacterized protein n=1 Tax=Grosmannia clavigera (strain kw1407 / UAMH 11150) TaxID=655863 RepID=F0XPG0_GROCL|nr:uncharacterized protein CMQ_7696 [Grosmannia clavigera kw1407]EFX00694.1 hypothetical protein CMQ_7696 [Grosmannia clavigera kw1407]
MPLIVPGVTANNLGDGETQEWLQKLAGKTLTDGSSSETAFSKQDLPKQARIVQPGQILSKDHEPKRLNVILAQDGTVENVYHG